MAFQRNVKNLFSDFVNDTIKGKVEASGWPDGIEDKENYIDSYKNHEQINLDPNNISINPGKSCINKLASNSMWVKFAQHSIKTITKYIDNESDFFKLLADDTITVKDAFLINEENIQIEFEKKSEFAENPQYSSLIIASYVTAHARLELYKLLEVLGKRVLYFDTDSVIFTYKCGEFCPPTGVFLGELTNELPTNKDSNVYISKFSSCGAKNYAYEIFYPSSNTRDYVIKVKGLTLNLTTEKIINFDSMKTIIDNYVDSTQQEKLTLKVPQMKFTINKLNDVFTSYFDKSYKLVMEKRKLSDNYTTLPFGYV